MHKHLEYLKYIIFLVVLLFAASSFAGTKYVRTNGNNSNDGSADDVDHAWLTVTYCLANAGSGNTCSIGDGAYSEPALIVPTGVSMTSTSGVASNVIIAPNQNYTTTPFVDLSSDTPGTSGNQSITYLTFNGHYGGHIANCGIKVWNRDDVTIDNNIITNFYGATITSSNSLNKSYAISGVSTTTCCQIRP